MSAPSWVWISKRQAVWLRSYLRGVEFDAIYSSASPRAFHTAEIVRDKRNLEIVTCESLKEINLGSWEGQRRSDLETLFPHEYKAFWNAPHIYEPSNGGESFDQLQNRVIAEVKDILSKHKEGNVLIVTHAITLKVIMAYFRGDPLEKLWAPPIIHPTSLNKVESSGIWDFPKGGVEEEDLDLEDAVLRELIEETGTDKYFIKQELPEKIMFTFNDDIRKRIGYERQETTMFLVEFYGTESDLKPCGKEVDKIIFVESTGLIDKLSHAETAAYVQQHCRFLLT